MREVQGYPLPLGVQISENKINFSIAVPTEKKCQLLIYRAGRKRLYRQFEMETAVGEVRCIALTDIEPAEYEYNYLIDGEVVVDPYVQALAGREHWGVKKETGCGNLVESLNVIHGNLPPGRPHRAAVLAPERAMPCIASAAASLLYGGGSGRTMFL